MKKHKNTLILVTLLALVTLNGCAPASDANNTTSSTNDSSGIQTTEDIPQEIDATLYAAYQTKDTVKKYGFINRSGEFVIAPIYDYVSDFSDNLAIVSDSNLFRVIDRTGAVIFENKGSIEPFHNGAAKFMLENPYRIGYIDTTGKIIVQPLYLIAEDFNASGLAVVSMGDDIFQTIDKEGIVQKTVDLGVKYEGVYNIKDGYATFTSYLNESTKMGVITLDGALIIEPLYNEIINLGQGLFAIKDPSKAAYEGLDTPMALFDETGTQLTDYVHYDVSSFTNGLASATDEHTTYFIDTDGKKITTLPVLDGRGTLLKVGQLIKADIDGALTYLKEDGSDVWQSENILFLSDALQINTLKYKPSRLVLVNYPVLDGLENDAIESEINKNLEMLFVGLRKQEENSEQSFGLSVDDSFTAVLNKDLLIVSKNGYDYYSGAAHGMPIWENYHINIKTGEFYSLSDLFKQDSSYLTALDTLIKEEIIKRNEDEDTMLFLDGFTGLTDDAYFITTQDHLIIYFYPYEIAPYAAGFPEFSIPYSEIQSFIDRDGEFWNSFEHVSF